MYLISYVAADFRDPGTGEFIYRVTPAMRGVLQSVPDAIAKAIAKDPLYPLLIADGSLKVTEDAREKRVLEQEPLLNVTAEGKRESEAPAPAPEAEKEAPRPGRPRAAK